MGALSLLVLLSSAGLGRSSWQKTIDVAGFQRTLVQKMTKEMLLVSQAIDPAANKGRIRDGAAQFDQTLHDLIDGSDSRGIMGSPSPLITAQLQEVDRRWHAYEELVLSNMDTVRGPDGEVAVSVLQTMAEQSSELLRACGLVVGALGDMAALLGAQTNGLQQDIAGRQRSYVQMMCKDALFISLGIDVNEHKEQLKQTKLLFEASHEGIIVGQAYVGIPVLSSLCTLHQMREVTYNYHLFRPFIVQILNTHVDAETQAVATQVLPEMVNFSEPFFDSMVDAVQLFVTHSDACDPRAEMAESDWLRYLDNLGHLRLLVEEVSLFFAQVAADIDPHAGKVELTVLMAQANQVLRKLIEGSKEDNISAPPTQEVVVHLQTAWEDWTYMETELTQVIRSNEILPDMADRISQLGQEILGHVEFVFRLCANMTTMEPSNLPYLMDVTSEQATRLANVAKEAYFISYGCIKHPHEEYLNATRAQFMASHWRLLEGATATSATPALGQVTDICALQKMKVAADLFHRLEEAALGLAHGRSELSGDLVEVFPLAIKAMQDAALFFKTGSADCVNASITIESLMQEHLQAASLATLSQVGSAQAVLAAQGSTSSRNSSKEAPAGAETEILAVLRRLTYGSPEPPVPAPPSQQVLDVILRRTSPAARSFSEQLSSQSSAEAILQAGDTLLAESDEIQTIILAQAAELDATFPALRVDAAARQITDATRIYKESLLLQFGFSTSPQERDAAIAAFEARLKTIQDGGGGLQPITAERKDLMVQMSRVQDSWRQFKAYASDTTTKDTAAMSIALASLREELSESLPLLAMKDGEPKAQFPWTAAIYIGVGVGLTCLCCSIAYVQYASSFKSKQDRSKKDGAVHGVSDAA